VECAPGLVHDTVTMHVSTASMKSTADVISHPDETSRSRTAPEMPACVTQSCFQDPASSRMRVRPAATGAGPQTTQELADRSIRDTRISTLSAFPVRAAAGSVTGVGGGSSMLLTADLIESLTSRLSGFPATRAHSSSGCPQPLCVLGDVIGARRQRVVEDVVVGAVAVRSVVPVDLCDSIEVVGLDAQSDSREVALNATVVTGL